MEHSYQFFENRSCKFFPCHEGLEEMNCLFCFCPLYHRDDCPGSPRYLEKDGQKIKVCTECSFPHRPENYDAVIELLKEKKKNDFRA